ncbi:lysophospholipid acyltransferase family protein [Hirschia litorea]|uniref:Lysophospholipid acyltransferase family protein n=1 Tax=Hirschia litorea TaxID=1199156 RepID=A0ABW2IJ57_9PROT
MEDLMERPRVEAPWTLSRLARLVTTALSFAFFGIGGLVLALVYFPLMRLFVWDSEKRAKISQASVHVGFRTFIETMRIMGVVSYEIHGAQKLKECRGTVVVANHPSLLDVVFMMAFMRRTRAVVKNSVATNPFMGGVIRSSNYIPNTGDPEALIQACSEALQEGANLCIFPEGSRTPIGAKVKYQRGFSYVALKSKAPVLIVTIEVTPPSLRKGEPWYSIPVKKSHWVIRVHETIDTEANYGNDRPVIGARRLATDVQSKIEKELRV